MQTPVTLHDQLEPEMIQACADLLNDHRVDMVSALLWKNHSPWDVAERVCLDDFFLIPVRGSFWAHLADDLDVSIQVEPGEFLLLPPGCPHSLEIAHEGELHQFSFHAHVVDRWKLRFLRRLGAFKGRFSLDQSHHRSFETLTTMWNQDRESGQRYGEGVIKHLLIEAMIGGLELRATQPETDPRVAAVLDRIHQSYGDDLGIGQLAIQVELSAVQLRKLFLRDVGIQPRTYLIRYRLQKATELLRQTTNTAKQVAYQVGFQEEHYFYLSFKKAFGCTPTQYRNRIASMV